jgi:transcriptional regulator with XRE-family HTH domain
MQTSIENTLYSLLVAGRPSSKIPTPNGARLAALRKAAGLSQIQLAQALNIPQRTISFYERDADHFPSTLLAPLAKILGVSVEEILGIDAPTPCKRGPKSRLERQLEAIADLPRSQQQKILEVVEALIERNSNGHKQAA